MPARRQAATAEPAPDTRTRILEAAFRRLASDGYAALRMREIADEAGVNHALINYHFRTKDQLVIAVLDMVNDRLLERQRAMFEGPGGFAEKWARAREFYRADLASGFCRVVMELHAACMANPALRDEFRPRLDAWHKVILQAVREAIDHYGIDLPVSAEVITVWVGLFWAGLELAMLSGVPTPLAPLERALDAVEDILKGLDARAAERDARPGSRRPATRRRK